MPAGDGGRDTEVLVCPLPQREGLAGGLMARRGERALVVLRESGRRAAIPSVILQQLYDLSPMDAEVVASLVKGYDTGEIAEHLQLTRETVRTCLKQIRSRTGVSRQAELVTLVLGGPAALAREDNGIQSR